MLDEHLTFKEHINTLKQKLSRANGILAKLRHYLSLDVLRTIYYALFDSHLRYACQVWGQANTTLIDTLQKLQNKALRIINFKPPTEPCQPLFKNSKILNLKDIVCLNNCLLVFDHINHNLPEVFADFFQPMREQHTHNTRGAKHLLMNIPKTKTSLYGSSSIKVKSTKEWNKIVEKLKLQIDSFTNRVQFKKNFINVLVT